MGRTARGVRGISLRDGDEVVGMGVIPREAPATLLTVCEKGYGKRTPTADYPTKNRGGKGVITIKTSDRNGKVVGAAHRQRRRRPDDHHRRRQADPHAGRRHPHDRAQHPGRPPDPPRRAGAGRGHGAHRREGRGRADEAPEVAAARAELAGQPLAEEDLGEEVAGADEDAEATAREAKATKRTTPPTTRALHPTDRQQLENGAADARSSTAARTHLSRPVPSVPSANRLPGAPRVRPGGAGRVKLGPPTWPTPASRRIVPTSESLYDRACQLFPGGVNSPVRAFKAVGGKPVFLHSGRGAHIQDVDGNRYLDFVGSWGPLIFGHADPDIIAAIVAAASSGTTFGAPTLREIDLAERIRLAVPSLEKLRFVSSGTEATMSALRVARGFTGRNKIVKIDGGYHGHADTLLAAAGSGALTLGIPGSAGVTGGGGRRHPRRPVQRPRTRWRRCSPPTPTATRSPPSSSSPSRGTWAWFCPARPTCPGCATLCDQHGTLLIFDEVISGFRVARGGAQQLYGVRPDMTCLGKVIGGGLPLGVYGGRADVMGVVAPDGPVYQAGHAVGKSAGRRRRDRHPEEAGRRRVPQLEMLGGMLEDGDIARDPAQRREGADPAGRLRVHHLLHRPGGDGPGQRAPGRHRPLRQVLPRHARPRLLSAAGAARGGVHLARPHRRTTSSRSPSPRRKSSPSCNAQPPGGGGRLPLTLSRGRSLPASPARRAAHPRRGWTGSRCGRRDLPTCRSGHRRTGSGSGA